MKKEVKHYLIVGSRPAGFNGLTKPDGKTESTFGHIFIGFFDTQNDSSINMYGFYPQKEGNWIGEGTIKYECHQSLCDVNGLPKDMETQYTIEVNKTDLDKAKSKFKQYSSMSFNWLDSNCIKPIEEVLSELGLKTVKWKLEFPNLFLKDIKELNQDKFLDKTRELKQEYNALDKNKASGQKNKMYRIPIMEQLKMDNGRNNNRNPSNNHEQNQEMKNSIQLQIEQFEIGIKHVEGMINVLTEYERNLNEQVAKFKRSNSVFYEHIVEMEKVCFSPLFQEVNSLKSRLNTLDKVRMEERRNSLSNLLN